MLVSEYIALVVLSAFSEMRLREWASVVRNEYCLLFCIQVNAILRTPAFLIDFNFLQIAFTSVVYPALILAYMGQAAYLSKHHNAGLRMKKIGFYVSVPGRSLNLLMKVIQFGLQSGSQLMRNTPCLFFQKT